MLSSRPTWGEGENRNGGEEAAPCRGFRSSFTVLVRYLGVTFQPCAIRVLFSFLPAPRNFARPDGIAEEALETQSFT